MRILAVSPLSEIYGGETVLLRALPALRRRGYEVRLAVPLPGPLRAAARARSIPTVLLPLGPPERLTPVSLLGLALAPAHLARCDVVWLNGLPTQRLLPALAVLGRPAVLRVNNPLDETPAWWRRAGFWRHVRAIVTDSSATAAQCVAAGAPRDRVHVLIAPAWDEDRRPAPAPARDEGSLRVGFVGRIEPRKGVLELVYAADRFLEGHPDATLTVIGAPPARDGGAYQAQVRSAAAAARNGQRIEFRGYVPDAAAELGGFDLLVVPSHEEPLGVIATEAAAVGVPVVASRVGGLPEAVGDGGVLVPPRDPDALAKAVSNLLGNPDRRRELSQRALAGASRFDPARFAATMDSLLRQIAGGS